MQNKPTPVMQGGLVAGIDPTSRAKSAFLTFSALTIAVAFWQAWTNDFQAQGRYPFPLLAMLDICLESMQRHLNEKVTLATVDACLTLSVYSFVFMGLVQLGGASRMGWLRSTRQSVGHLRCCP